MWIDCSPQGSRGAGECSPPGGATWLIWRCKARVCGKRAGGFAKQGSGPPAAERQRLPQSDASCRLWRAASAQRRHRVADHRCGAGASGIRLRLPDLAELESGHREIRCARADLRHRRHLLHRHADRGADRPVHRDVPHRALPAMAAPADRHRDRTAGRHSEHHLRHLGPVRVRARSCRTRCSRS